MKNFFIYLTKVIFILGVFAFLGGVILFCREFYLKEHRTDIKISVEGKQMDELMVSKGDALVVQFSGSVLKESVENNFELENNLNIETDWRGRRYFRIEIKEDPIPGEEYHIAIKNIRTKWYIPMEQEVDFNFSGVTAPEIKEVNPENNQKDVDYDSLIRINLDRPMGDEYFLEFKSTPKFKFDYTINEDRSNLEIIPLEKLQENEKYNININVRHRAFDEFKKNIYDGFFVTKSPPFIVYNFDKNGAPLKTQEREEEVKPQITEGKYVDIDISSQSLFIFEDGIEKGAFKVSTGLRGMDTPVGTFEAMGKAIRPWSRKYELYMPWWIQFTNQGHGIHELPEWPGGVKEGVHHLGIPVSHGCVRLGVGPAKLVYDFVEVGMPIVIHQ
ncbi:MAG: L,D-transpeptidase family protein [Patescibacteria group bacterium]|jgi:lipoprotein-anchoring transpeptidase ErfK/SrfK|nr:L,D-transpeptidase family protein [Patescibacteria group bacterium]